MDEEFKNELVSKIEPLQDNLGEYLQAVAIFGSLVHGGYEEGSDIDILVILDDSEEGYSPEVMDTASRIIEQIEDDEEGLDLHIQPPLRLSEWWQLLIEGKPWLVTAVKHSEPLYDPKGLLPLVKRMVEGTPPQRTEERSLFLLRSSEEKLEQTRKILDRGIYQSLFAVMEKIASTVLRVSEVEESYSRDLMENLENLQKEHELSDEAMDTFVQVRRIVGGEKESPQTWEEAETYIDRTKEFTAEIINVFSREIVEEEQAVIEKVHDRLEELCKEALETDAGEDVFSRFRQEYVEKGRVREEYWEFIDRVRELKETGSYVEQSLQETQNLLVHLRDFETSLENITDEEIEPEIHLRKEFQPGIDQKQVDAVNSFEERLLEKQGDSIRAIWLLTIEEFLETKGATLVILVDEESGTDIGDIEKEASEIEKEILDEYGFHIHTDIYTLTRYWENLQSLSPQLISEISEGIPVYDPGGLFEPVRKAILRGDIPDTLQALEYEIFMASKQVSQVRAKLKSEVMKGVYDATVKAVQAALVGKEVSPPVQTQVPDRMKEHLVESTEFSEVEAEKADRIISTWKDYDHGTLEDDTDIDQLLNDCESVIETTRKVLTRPEG